MLKFRSPFQTSFFSIILFVLFISACSDKNTNEPITEPQNSPVGNAEIGPEGGAIGSDEFKLTIPGGAFNEVSELSLTESDDNLLFGEEAVSKTFYVNGLPENINIPLKITIRHNNSLSENSYIAVGSIIPDQKSGGNIPVFNLIEGNDSSGFLIANIGPHYFNIDLIDGNTNAYLKTNGEYQKIIQAITNYKTYRSNNFEFLYPTNIGENFYKSAEKILERSYDFISDSLNMRFGKEISSDSLWPVAIYNLKDEGIAEPFKLTFTKTSFFTKPAFIMDRFLLNSEIENIDAYAVPELLNLWNDEYTRKNKFNPSFTEFNGQIIWLSEAIFSWLEEYYSNDNFSYPENFDINPLAAFNGINYGAFIDESDDGVILHAYGMAALIKFLIDNSLLKKSDIGEIFNLIGNGSEPVTALIDKINGLRGDWWPEFVRELISGNIYSINQDVFIENPDGEWIVTNNNDIDKEFHSNDAAVGKYADLSAKRFILELNNSDVLRESRLNLKVEGDITADGLSIILFAQNNNNLEFLADGSFIQIDKIKDNYYDQGITKFLAVVVNSLGEVSSGGSYLQKSNVYFTLKIEGNEAGNLDYIFCHPEIRISKISGTRKNLETGDISQGDYESFFTTDDINLFWYTGEFSGNTFSGEAESEIGSVSRKGNITVQVNPAQDMITNVEITTVTTYTEELTGVNTVTKTLRAKDIPLDSPGIFGVWFENVCDYVESVYYHHINEKFENTFDQFECTNQDKISFEFAK